jgi:hypothetical protein
MDKATYIFGHPYKSSVLQAMLTLDDRNRAASGSMNVGMRRSKQRSQQRRGFGVGAALVPGMVIAALGAGCGGDGGGDATELDGVVWITGPVDGAVVTAYQLVDGARTTTLATTTTGADGAWHLAVGVAYEHLELEARGGAYTEATGGRVVLDAGDPLRGLALAVEPGEHRAGVAITPWSHLVVALADARLAAGRAANANAALDGARGLIRDHLDLDPTQTPIADLAATAGSPTPAVRHALSLAGLAQLADQIARAAGLTVQDVNAATALGVLAADAGSAEALFDGNADTLVIGPACALPPACTERGDGCHADCTVYANTLRSRLALAIAGYLQRGENATGLVREDVQSWLEHLADHDPREPGGAPALFGGAPEPLDAGGPLITWLAPAAGAVVARALAIDVVAADPLGVAAITVAAVGESAAPIADTDARAEVFAGALDTTGVADGALTLRATATDEQGNTATADVVVTVDNLDGGTASGAVIKGPIGGAAVRVYRYTDGVKGALLGAGTTAADGRFTNIALADGYAGPLLIEAGGGGSYAEEAAPATVGLDVDDTLRSVVADYADGQAIAAIAVTPLTAFAVTYYEYLRGAAPGAFGAQWGQARGAIEAQFGVPDVVGLVPQRPAEMTALSAPARYGLVLVGLSRTAYQASAQGGGDAGTFGTAMHAVRVWRVLDDDLADGCWNGRAGATPLAYGGTQVVTPEATRKLLADRVVAYLDSAANATPFTGAADVLALLETLSQGGPAAGTGTACAAGELYPTPGQSYDQTPPELALVAPTPAAGALVRQTIQLRAEATDDLTAPVVTWTAPAGLADDDGVPDNAVATGSIATAALPDGPLTITARATDASTNAATRSRTFTIDNTAPALTWPATGFLADAGPPAVWWTTDRGAVLAGTVSDAHAVTIAAVIGAATYPGTVAGGAWSIDLPANAIPTAPTEVVIRATDGAGNQASIAHVLAGDDTAPVVTVAAGAATTVHDERNDVVTFDAVTHRAIHTHTADAADDAVLGTAAGCPAVYKYAYFLDETGPPLVTEAGDPNPLAWAFSVTDTGVGIDPAGAGAYRVIRGDTETALTGWLALDGAPIAGGESYGFALYRRDAAGAAVLPLLGTYEGAIRVELRGRDRFGRQTIASRCFDHHPLAPALAIGDAVQATDHPAAGVSALRLLSLPGNDPISAAVLDAAAAGAGLSEIELWQGAPEPIYLDLALTPPTAATTYTKSTQVTWAHAATAAGSFDCGLVDDGVSDDDRCKPIGNFPLVDPGPDVPATPTTLTPTYRLRVFRDGGATWTEQSPCAGCGPSEYLLPATTGAAHRYVVIVAIAGIADDFGLGGSPPYGEVVLAYGGGASTVTITGELETTAYRCGVALQIVGSGPTQRYVCPAGSVRTYRRYRMLKSASVTFPGAFTVAPALAPTASLPPRADLPGVEPKQSTPQPWTTTESPIPAPLTTP